MVVRHGGTHDVHVLAADGVADLDGGLAVGEVTNQQRRQGETQERGDVSGQLGRVGGAVDGGAARVARGGFGEGQRKRDEVRLTRGAGRGGPRSFVAFRETAILSVTSGR